MLKNFTDIERYIKEHSVAMVDLKYADLFGGWHHVTLPAEHATPSVLGEGIGFDSSSVPGFKTIESGDMILLPDPSTAFIDPFWDLPVLSLICNIAEADSQKPCRRDPRGIALRAEKHLRQSGVADRSLWGPEFEYYLFEDFSYRVEDNVISPFTNVNGQDGNGISHLGWRAAPSAYHAIPPQDRGYNLRAETSRLLEAAGVEVHYHHHEVGRPSQQEIEVVLGSLTRIGDITLMVKYFVKMTAKNHGYSATFMPKPLYAEAGSGMHFHQHLFKGTVPLFYDKKGYAGLSQLALSYIAGILKHAPALLALTNPSTNSYKRLVPGYEAPVNLFFSLANRSAAIRVPKYTRTPVEKRIEFRPPDATCNPYIAMSAMLLAGLDGIKKQMDPADLGFGPFDQNLFALENEELRKSIKRLPASLKEALEALADDHEFLLEGEVFPVDLIETWIDYKMKREFSEIRNRPHPYEVALYYDC